MFTTAGVFAAATRRSISTFLSSHTTPYKGNLLNIVSIVRYLYLGQKYGLGLMNPSKEIFVDSDVPALSYAESLSSFEAGISLLNRLSDEDMAYLMNDSTNAIKIIHHYDIMAREWELFNKESDSVQSADITSHITQFRARFINVAILEQFNALLESDKIDLKIKLFSLYVFPYFYLCFFIIFWYSYIYKIVIKNLYCCFYSFKIILHKLFKRKFFTEFKIIKNIFIS